MYIVKHLNKLSLTHFTIRANIDGDLDLAFLSDLHCCDNDPILDLLRAKTPDAVLVGGDFIHNNSLYREGLDFLRQSSELCPTFCSIGNHELRFLGDLHAAVKETGAVLLDNTSVTFRGVQIGGLTSALKEQRNLKYFITEQVPDLNWLVDFAAGPGFKILLCHHPEYFRKYIRPLPIQLILSGHAHGGQWRIFNRGVYAVGQGIFPKYTGGMYENRLVVSKGLGNASRIPRINNHPEIVMLHLKAFTPEFQVED